MNFNGPLEDAANDFSAVCVFGADFLLHLKPGDAQTLDC